MTEQGPAATAIAMSTAPVGTLVEALEPLLAGMSRLAAGGAALDDDTTGTLLLGLDVPDREAALAELRRWGRLLALARGEPARTAAVIETFRLRGVAEATALLAVATVTDGRALAATSPSGALRIQPDELDFGTLIPGEPAWRELTIHGGPGQVVAESPQVVVEPSRFEESPAVVRVTVGPLDDGAILTNLRVITRAGAIGEVSVYARWGETVAALASALPGSGPATWADLQLGRAHRPAHQGVPPRPATPQPGAAANGLPAG